jgi:hypothetical protein
MSDEYRAARCLALQTDQASEDDEPAPTTPTMKKTQLSMKV